MSLQTVPPSYASHDNEVIPATRTTIHQINTAFHAAPVTFSILAANLKPTPPSAMTDIVVAYTLP